MTLLQVEGLAVDFPIGDGRKVRAVEGVDLRVDAGEIVCIVGESGCGKSVTVRSLFNLLPPPGRRSEGRVIFDGTDIDTLSAEQQRELCGTSVGYVFQDPMTYLNPLLTVGAQICEAFAGHVRFNRDPVAMQRILELLGELGIGDPKRVVQSYPHQLSGGMRQRILIAMAIARRPKLLILDEPTTALDVTIQAQIVDLIRVIQKHTQCGMIFVTHDFGLVAELADRVYVMYAGQLVEQNNVEAIFNAPQHPYTKGLIECVIPVGESAGLRTIPGEVPNLRMPPPGCRFAVRCPRKTAECEAETPPLETKAQGQIRCFHSGGDGASPAVDVGTLPRRDDRFSGIRAEDGDSEAGSVTVEAATKYFPARGGSFGSKAMVHALNTVSVTLEPGEIFALVGESGSGKSTLGRLVAGLEMVSGGRIVIGNQNPAKRLASGSKPLAQMVFQDPYSSLNPRKTIRHTLAQPLLNYKICRRDEVEARSIALLELIGLTPAREFLDRHPHELSGGQRQRVVMARALAAEPRVLVADEPVSSLDMSTRAQILGLLQELRRKMGLTILLITHDLAVVSTVADRMGVMYLGRLFEIAPAKLGVAAPLQPYTQMLVSSVPLPDPQKARTRERLLMNGEPPSPLNLPSGCYLHARCPKALPTCKVEAPEWREMQPGHHVACHLY
ncbi:dipeptide ABC transporter ATP-binding protein [Devosia faecipullorum]|uniref:dipeptide ABC transporter ATP-binding protein n=1 Tax=Devosia faecipullorum TaxID=2755039 RepID=UPI00187BAC9A|nr:ABC transporter ATP-binding protein [Devosia faecipullorum]MBE7732828.1 ABC transporter ATP-binding protein [Devosia faecipullorum]